MRKLTLVSIKAASLYMNIGSMRLKELSIGRRVLTKISTNPMHSSRTLDPQVAPLNDYRYEG